MNISKVVTFRASSIGDCLMAKYLLDNIHAYFPKAKCAIVVASRSRMIRDLLAAYPWIEVIEANRRNPFAVFGLFRKYRRSDLVVTQYTGKKESAFSLLSKIMARILARKGGLVGFSDASAWNSRLFDTLIHFSLNRSVIGHEREVLRIAGVPVSNSIPALLFKKDGAVLDRFSLQPNSYVIVHLFAGGAGRGLSPDKKRELINAIAGRYPNLKILVSGGPADKAEAAEVSQGSRGIMIAGDTTLQELMNLISESVAVVSVDTGVAHIAAHLRKRLSVMRTCLAPNWWFDDQYGVGAPIKVYSADDVCSGGHAFNNYPVCINSVNIQDVATGMVK